MAWYPVTNVVEVEVPVPTPVPGKGLTKGSYSFVMDNVASNATGGNLDVVHRFSTTLPVSSEVTNVSISAKKEGAEQHLFPSTPQELTASISNGYVNCYVAWRKTGSGSAGTMKMTVTLTLS